MDKRWIKSWFLTTSVLVSSSGDGEESDLFRFGEICMTDWSAWSSSGTFSFLNVSLVKGISGLVDTRSVFAELVRANCTLCTVLQCLWSKSLLTNDDVQCKQWYGFSLVWDRSCRCLCSDLVKALAQNAQMYFLGVAMPKNCSIGRYEPIILVFYKVVSSFIM